MGSLKSSRDMPRQRKELRCFCRYRPLLGTYGIDNRGRLHVHVKVYKGKVTYAELLVYGSVKLRCRLCFRWHTVIIDSNKRARLEPLADLPDELDLV